MKKHVILLSIAFAGMVMFSSCTEDPVEVIIDSNLPNGDLSVSRAGSFIDQNAAGSTGSAELGTDEEGVQFLRFDDSFMTALGTGTVTVYFSTSMDYIADPATGNPDLRLVGICQMNGENFYKLDPTVGSEFTHVILWCGSANIPFGYAELN